ARASGRDTNDGLAAAGSAAKALYICESGHALLHETFSARPGLGSGPASGAGDRAPRSRTFREDGKFSESACAPRVVATSLCRGVPSCVPKTATKRRDDSSMALPG